MSYVPPEVEDIPLCVKNEALELITGDFLGDGTFRKVWEYALEPEQYVIKFETSAGHFHNVSEWQMWQQVKGTKWEKWFAPCLAISHSGSVLIQRRVLPLRALPDQIPNFFTDVKLRNWGDLEGRPVCIDYGYHKLVDFGMSKARMAKRK